MYWIIKPVHKYCSFLLTSFMNVAKSCVKGVMLRAPWPLSVLLVCAPSNSCILHLLSTQFRGVRREMANFVDAALSPKDSAAAMASRLMRIVYERWGGGRCRADVLLHCADAMAATSF